jgi:succinate dehydrogenase/fumarate reductase-like Fe-S protein
MAGGFQRLKGDLYMGYRAAIAHPLRLLFSGDERTGKQKFLDNYAPEGLLPTSAEDREILYAASRCIHCGLCDAYDAALSSLPRTLYDGASAMPVSWSRATPDLPTARNALERIHPEQLARAESVCPTRVPLRRIAAFLQRKLEELARVRARGDGAEGPPR